MSDGAQPIHYAGPDCPVPSPWPRRWRVASYLLAGACLAAALLAMVAMPVWRRPQIFLPLMAGGGLYIAARIATRASGIGWALQTAGWLLLGFVLLLGFTIVLEMVDLWYSPWSYPREETRRTVACLTVCFIGGLLLLVRFLLDRRVPKAQRWEILTVQDATHRKGANGAFHPP